MKTREATHNHSLPMTSGSQHTPMQANDPQKPQRRIDSRSIEVASWGLEVVVDGVDQNERKKAFHIF